MRKQKLYIALISSFILLGMTIAGCAQQQFQKAQFVATTSAAGSRSLPAKVDILLVIDNSASMSNAISIVQAQLGQFISNLQGEFWDYHVAHTTIMSPTNINQVLVNPTYNTQNLPDGTFNQAGGIVPPGSAITQADSSNFPLLITTTPTGGGEDYTYSDIYGTLVNAKNDKVTNFLRDDALLAIVVVTNGAEYSVDPNHNGTINTNLLQQYANNLISLKGGSNLIRFFSAASFAYRPNSCLTIGGTAWPGTSYLSMNNYIPGFGADFCDPNALNNVLDNINQKLQAIRQSYVYSSIVLDQQPIPDSIVITNNGTTIPRDNANGWSYPCSTCNTNGLGTVYTITAVQDQTTGRITALNPGLAQQTGYVIQLNGSARMIGSATPQVQYERQ